MLRYNNKAVLTKIYIYYFLDNKRYIFFSQKIKKLKNKKISFFWTIKKDIFGNRDFVSGAQNFCISVFLFLLHIIVNI